MASSRLTKGGLIDRDQSISFQYNGKTYIGFAGDTLASAMLANDIHIVGRSFKRHRPRGLISLGLEEPNAIVTLSTGSKTLPNRIASEVELLNGLDAKSTRGWPSSKFDIFRALDWVPRAVAAGFYYKTFMGHIRRPKFDTWNSIWEPLIRRMAGQSPAPVSSDTATYQHTDVHVDVAVIGAGLAGLAAALCALNSGKKVAIFERDSLPGGRVHSLPGCTIDGETAENWAASTWGKLEEKGIARLRATGFGLYDHGFLTVFEKSATKVDGGRIWHVRAKKIVIATGALERPMVFPGNDLPGVMLSGAVETAINRFAILPGKKAVLYGNHEDLNNVRTALKTAGAEVVAEVQIDETITGTFGSGRLKMVEISKLGTDGLPERKKSRRISADLVVTSGGWSPMLHLYLMAGGQQTWSPEVGAFIATTSEKGTVKLIGAANARFTARDALKDGATLEDNNFSFGDVTGNNGPIGQGLPIAPILQTDKQRAFVDFQHDVTVADIELAAREGFRSIEHTKRYTTSGMGTDQGRTAQLATAAALATATQQNIQEIGLSGVRPPLTPVPFGAFAGRRVGRLFQPERHTSIHARHLALGAVFEDVGDWKRPRYYPKPGETMAEAVARECRSVRTDVGMLDVSTLGKIDVAGPDAAEFLNRLYTNRIDTIKPGKCRYGIMLKDDGMVFDDGVVARIDEDRFLVTTTSGGAAAVLAWMEDWRQTEWPDLRVRLTSLTEQWAGIAVAGPNARSVIKNLIPKVDLSSSSLPNLGWQETVLFDQPARIFRVSFSGELGFEIYVHWQNGSKLWDAIKEAGAAPYGTEAMHVLRAEMGFIVVGHETDGTVTPVDLGMDWILSKTKGDFIGKRALKRPSMLESNRKQLVGLVPTDPSVVLDEGAQIIEHPRPRSPEPMIGHVTSSYWSETLSSGFALALVKDGFKRQEEKLFAWSLGKIHEVEVRPPIFIETKKN